MAEGQSTSPGFQVKLPVKVESAKISDEETILIGGASNLLLKEEDREDETTHNGKHKSEKEVLSLNQTSGTANPESSSSVANATFLEMEEKIKELALQLENTAKELKHSESNKASLKSEVDLALERLSKMDNHCDELELDRKMMEDQISEAQKKYDSQLNSLQEALAVKDVMQKELLDVKKTCTVLSDELENSRKRTKELEQELMSSATEVHKLDELSKHWSSQADRESQRALQLEKMLSTLQEQLELSKSRAEEMEQKLTSNDAFVGELTKELSLYKASEEQMKAEMLALEHILSATKEDLQTKLVNLKDVEIKLQEQVKEREAIETHLRNQELQLSNLQDDLYNLNGEKVRLQTTVADLGTRLLENEEIRSELEAKLNLSEEKVNKTATLLSGALSYNDDLEQKLKLFEEVNYESRAASEVATKRTLELEELIHAANAAEEGLREQLKEAQMKLEADEKKNMELEGELNFAETKFLDAEEQIEELSEQIAELTSVLKEVDEETTLSKRQFDGYKTTIGQLESSLNKSFSRNTQLEKELNSLVHKCAEQEGFATTTHQRSLELENLIRSTNSRAESAEKRVTELEKLLEAAKSRSLELERLLRASEARHKDAETESKQHSSRASELLAELEAYQTRAESLEAVLRSSNEREKELTDSLMKWSFTLNEERKKFEQLSNIYGKKLSEAEKTVQYLQSDLRYLITQGENIEEDLQASRVREKVLLDKLKYAGEQLERRGKAVEEVTARNLELQSQNEYLLQELELKLQEASLSFRWKESETKELRERIKSVEEERAFYKAQAIEATETVATLKDELEANARKVISLVQTVEELQQKISDSNVTLEHTFSENDMLARTCTQLREELEVHHLKVSELHELLKSVHVEKEAAAEQLASQSKTIESLTHEHSRGLDTQFAAESRLKEIEAQLREAIEKLAQRNHEAGDLSEKLFQLESQLQAHEAQATSQKVKLEGVFLKLQSSEALAEQLRSECEQYKAENGSLSRENVRLSKELSVHEERARESAALVGSQKGNLEGTLLKLQELEALVGQLESKSEKYRTDAEGLTRENTDLSRELAAYEEWAHESAALLANQKEKLEDSLLRLQDLEGLVDEWQKKSYYLKIENEDLAREHLRLSQDLANYEGKTNELETAFNAVAAEKEDKSTQLHSLRNEMDNLMQQLTSDNKSLQSQITTVIEDNNMLNEMCQKARNELEATLVHLEEKVSEGKEREISLTTNMSSLQTELAEKEFMHARISELEEKLLQAEKNYSEEIERVRAAAVEKEAALNEKLKEYSIMLQERDALEQHLSEISQRKTQEQKKLTSMKDLKRQASMKQSLDELETERRHVTPLELQIEALEQKLQEAEIQYKEKAMEESAKYLLLNEELSELHQKLSEAVEMEKKITELEIKLQQTHTSEVKGNGDCIQIQSQTEDSVEVKSRELGKDTSVLSDRKHENDGLRQTPEITSAHPITQVDSEPSGAMALRFILGVAFVSVIVGIILGKRY